MSPASDGVDRRLPAARTGRRAEIGAAIDTLSRRYHGVVSRRIARQHGLEQVALRSQRRAGRLEKRAPRLLIVKAVPPSFEQQAMAAVLITGGAAVLSGFAAAYLHGLSIPARIAKKGEPPEKLEVLADPKANSRNPGVKLTRRLHLGPEDRGELKGIPIATVPRALVECARWLKPFEVKNMVSDALSRKQTTLEAMEALVARLPRNQRSTHRIVAALSEWRLARGSESPKELDVMGWIRAAGLPAPEQQVAIPHGAETIRTIDGGWPAWRVGWEYHSRAWHEGKQTMVDEHVRRLLEQLG